MKFCPFCGSPAAAWPEYASDYVRGYPLCEHHMRGALKMATFFEYDDRVVAREDMRCRLEKEVFNLLESWAEGIEPNCMDYPEDHPVLMDVYSRATEKISHSYRPDYGEPLSKRIDDEEVSRWFSVRISDLSRRSSTKRCDAKLENSADGRCTNYATRSDGFCDQCSKSSSMKLRALRGADKIKQIMEMLRDE